MRLDKPTSLASRVFFLGAAALVGLAVLEGFANLFGYTILRDVYTSGRLIEFAAVLVIFIIAILLRQIRDQLRESASRG